MQKVFQKSKYSLPSSEEELARQAHRHKRCCLGHLQPPTLPATSRIPPFFVAVSVENQQTARSLALSRYKLFLSFDFSLLFFADRSRSKEPNSQKTTTILLNPFSEKSTFWPDHQPGDWLSFNFRVFAQSWCKASLRSFDGKLMKKTGYTIASNRISEISFERFLVSLFLMQFWEHSSWIQSLNHTISSWKD
jgi:hypothetical protein